jgi:hypothetical protein
MPFGSPHHHHVLCREDGAWRVRRWVCDPQKGEAYLKEHGYFMPESAEAISEPGPDVVLEATEIDEVLALLKKSGLLD